jgi:hypothetical protein
MRSVAIAFAFLIAGSVAALAETATWHKGRFCAEMETGNTSAGKPSCRYKTMAQCQEAVKDHQGICFENKK